MHITTHHIPAKRRHIDAATRLRRLLHVVAASTRVVRGCKSPPPLTKRNTPNCFITALGSDRSGLCPQHATCAPLGPTAAERGFARAYGSTLEARRLWGFIASVLIQPRHLAVRAHVFALMPRARRPAFSVWAVDSSCPYPSFFGNVCGTSASVKMGEMALAELPQASKWGKWPLRNFRKRQNGGNGLCGTSASVKMGEMAFAELPRVSKWKKWPLRNFRKHQNGGNGPCGTSASVKVEGMAFAELPQASKWKKWPLRNFRKRCSIYSYTIPNN